LGLYNLWNALRDDPPELIVGLSSIIGFTGMPGNAWYGFTNEFMELLMEAIKAQSPATRTQSVAFSIWGETGMGARMGSVSRLEQMGISAIPTDEGRRRFAALFTNDPGSSVVIVTARLGGLDTWPLPVPGQGPQGRFSREPLLLTPGVEAVFKTSLEVGRDLYLADHDYQGSLLFPTVFGLEALAQAGFTAAGIASWHHLKLENVRLQRPITVDPDQETEILIWAQVEEKQKPQDPVKIRAGIRKTDSGITEDYFSAVLIVDAMDQGPQEAEAWPEAMPLKPLEDLYRDTLLFQGERFQRIEDVYSMDGNGRDQGLARLGVRRKKTEASASEAFRSEQDGPLVLPDPFFSDALLQSAAVLVPQDPCLPITIDRLDFYTPAHEVTGLFKVQVTLLECRDKTFHTAVQALDENGRRLMGLEGYCLKILKHVDSYPTLADLKNPVNRDRRLLKQILTRTAQQLGVDLPEVEIDYLPGIHLETKKKRCELESPLIKATLAGAYRRWNLSSTKVIWQKSGKPVVIGTNGNTPDLSLSHDERLCLASAGPQAQGCDVAPVTSRSREEWSDLLGMNHAGLLDTLIQSSDNQDQAGTSVWAALEAARKALGVVPLRLELKERIDNGALFEAESGKGRATVLTQAVRLTWGPQKIIALVVGRLRGAQAEPAHFPAQFAGLCQKPAYEVRPDGPAGELIFVQRFPVTFKPGAQLSRNVYFTNFFDWMGHAREASTYPVMRDLINMLGSGRWGSVTNFSRLKILGEARTGDLIQLRMWTSANDGPQQGTMTLQYEFTRLTPSGAHEQLALAELQTTWVELVGHGLAKPAPYPPVLQTFFDDMIPKGDPLQPDTSLPAALADWHRSDADDLIYLAPAGPVIRPQLAMSHMETFQGEANAVGNVYYAKYYEWQGKLRDRYLQALIPDYFGGIGEHGEILCLNCRVDHLREAMPFDTITVGMSLKRLCRTRATLYFEYFRSMPGQAPVKLAYGTHEMVWVRRDEQGLPTPAPFPDQLRRAFDQAIAQEQVRADQAGRYEATPDRYLARS
jgi:acyl-CoA thioesterase FadM